MLYTDNTLNDFKQVQYPNFPKYIFLTADHRPKTFEDAR